MEIAAYVIGPGRETLDIYDDWARAREVEESGAVLVRPDGHVAWRTNALADDPVAALRPRWGSSSALAAEAAAS